MTSSLPAPTSAPGLPESWRPWLSRVSVSPQSSPSRSLESSSVTASTSVSLRWSALGASEIEEGMRVRVDVDAGRVDVIDTGQSFDAVPLPAEISAILRAGGLVPLLQGRFQS